MIAPTTRDNGFPRTAVFSRAEQLAGRMAGYCFSGRNNLHHIECIRKDEKTNMPRKMRALMIAAMFFGAGVSLQAQTGQSDAPAKPKSNKQTDSATKNAEDQPKWDPLRAEKDLEVGKYYMKTGNIDAAIDRFQDATEAKPGYAVPFLYLGEAQDKKGLKRDALKSYSRYLELYPHAEDRPKIEKRIEKLRAETGEKKKP